MAQGEELESPASLAALFTAFLIVSLCGAAAGGLFGRGALQSRGAAF
jgi:hypothetical protein